MAEDLDRDGIIGLLESLGSERDADVVEAAREIHARVTAAGVPWDALLAPDAAADDEAPRGTAEEEDEDAAGREEADGEDALFAEADGEDAAPAAPGDGDGGNKESLALIARLLAKSDISKDMREELQGYKEDIAEGDFEDMDRKYLRSLHARLTKRR